MRISKWGQRCWCRTKWRQENHNRGRYEQIIWDHCEEYNSKRWNHMAFIFNNSNCHPEEPPSIPHKEELDEKNASPKQTLGLDFLQGRRQNAWLKLPVNNLSCNVHSSLVDSFDCVTAQQTFLHKQHATRLAFSSVSLAISANNSFHYFQFFTQNIIIMNI